MSSAALKTDLRQAVLQAYGDKLVRQTRALDEQIAHLNRTYVTLAALLSGAATTGIKLKTFRELLKEVKEYIAKHGDGNFIHEFTDQNTLSGYAARFEEALTIAEQYADDRKR